MARLAGQPVDRPPNFDIMMQFAAHTIGQPLAKYYLDYRVLCAANFAVLEAFDLDILQAISDPYREAADCGAAVEFPDDGLPISKRYFLSEPEDLRKLKPPKPEAGRR
ncbi:MAG: uroporphyrinogen decarboxylase, partial [Anaerolineae bacterium]|nr:uroporphyrinogen decarboxylase [Anaerolineae bacterium]